jgi:HlyD family secretion protein
MSLSIHTPASSKAEPVANEVGRIDVQQAEIAPAVTTKRAADPAVVAVLQTSRKKSKTKRVLLILLVVLVAAATAYGVHRWRTRAKSPGYELSEVRQGDLRLVVTATGTLEAKKTVEIGAEVTGRVTRVAVDYNDIVKKGQELATIDPEQLRASTEQSRAELSAARATVLEARATATETALAAARAEEQSKRGLISPQQLETARATAARAEAALSSAEARTLLSRASLGLASTRLEKTKIVSPIDGIVLSRAVEPGQTVTAGFQTPIMFKLAEDLSQMRLATAVDEADIGRVRAGLIATFTVDAYPDREFSSRVLSVRNEPKVSQNVVTYQAVLEVDNTERLLRPGMTATASVVSETLKSVVLVSSEAFRFIPPERPGKKKLPPAPTNPRERRVFVLEGEQPKPIIVKIGASDGNVTVVESGNLAPGTKVILDVIEAP